MCALKLINDGLLDDVDDIYDSGDPLSRKERVKEIEREEARKQVGPVPKSPSLAIDALLWLALIEIPPSSPIDPQET